MEETGSPGMIRSTTKTTLRRIKTIGIVRSNRVMIYLARFFIDLR